MKKVDGWVSHLFDYVKSVWTTPFEWGKFDCFIFMGGAIRAMTGDGFVDQIIGKYSSYEEALEICRQHGYTSPLDFIVRNFEQNPSILHTMRGDIVIVKDDGELLIGICQGDRVYLVGDTGIVTCPLEMAKRSYRV